jgi:hypothetical protein
VVKVGFIVEGFCERIILKSAAFATYLGKQGIELVSDVVNLEGKGALNTARMQTQVQVLRDKGAEHIIVLRDLDDAPCFTSAKQEVFQAYDVKICIAVRELEAWYLADSQTLSTIFQRKFYFDEPEAEVKPIETLKRLRQDYQGVGISDKKLFTKLMLREGFTIEQSAQHPNCSSARYFLNKLQNLTT